MLGNAKNYDVICLQMRNYLPHLESPIKKETSLFLKEVESVIKSGLSFKTGLDKLIPQIFNFRIKALKWLSEESDIDFASMIDVAYPQIEELKNNPKLGILADNILFALRCNARVAKTLISSGELNRETISKEVANVSVITYEQFLGTLAFSVPDESAVQKLADWINTSLYIEFIAVAATLIYEDNIKVSDAIINEMAYLIANAAQDYIAISTEMGLLKTRSYREGNSNTNRIQDLSEDKYLADSGLDNFAKLF